MKKFIIGKHEVEIFDTIDEMLITRYKEYNKYLIIESGIGSTLDDINRNMDKLAAYITAKDSDNALKQLMLLKQSLYFAMQGQAPDLMSFACLIYSVDGDVNESLTPESLQEVLNKFKNKLTVKVAAEILDSIKKKVENEMESVFPSLTDSGILKEYYDKLRQRTLLVLRQIIEGVDLTEEILKIDTFLMTHIKPEVFHGKDSIELKYQKEFEEMCFILNQLTNKEAKSMTVVEYYTAYEMLKKQKPKKTKKNGR